MTQTSDTTATDSGRCRSNVFVHIPFDQRDRYLPIALRDRLNVELYLTAQDLDQIGPLELSVTRCSLDKAGVKCTIHGPYMDLNIGAFDPEVRAVTGKRILQALDVASKLSAGLIVLHGGYDGFRYSGLFDQWVENSRGLLAELGDTASEKGVHIALENTLENAPDPLCRIVDSLDPNVFGHCFDIGHFNVFGRDRLEEWLRSIKGRLLELHLHDNRGDHDEHGAISEGTADFERLFRLLLDCSVREDLVLTIEAHDEASVQRSLAELDRLLRTVGWFERHA